MKIKAGKRIKRGKQNVIRCIKAKINKWIEQKKMDCGEAGRYILTKGKLFFMDAEAEE